MRIFAISVLALLVSPVLAEDWGRYTNADHGFVVDIPADFTVQSEDEGGVVLAAPDRPTYLMMWGAEARGDLEAAVKQELAAAAADAWNVTSEKVTPQWAEFAAIKGSRLIRQRMITLCDGTGFAAARVDYSVVETVAVNAMFDRVGQSLAATGC